MEKKTAKSKQYKHKDRLVPKGEHKIEYKVWRAAMGGSDSFKTKTPQEITFLPLMEERENPTFSYSEILPLLKYLGYTQEEASELLETNPSTLSRWKKSEKQVDIGKLRSKVVLDIDEIVSKGVRVFGTEELFQDWLNTSNYILNDEKPVDLLKDVYSMELVEDAIDAMSSGSYL